MDKSTALVFAGVMSGMLAGCGSSPALGTGGCAAGHSRTCSCGDGAAGVAVCDERGSFGTCECVGPDGGASGPGRCGDGICNAATEDCMSCSEDCGACPSCGFSPSCTDAVGVPTKTSPEKNLSDPGGGPWAGSYDGEQMPASCGPAKLRLRIMQLHATRNDGDQMYCIIQASDGLQSGVAITNKTKGLGDGNDYFFDPSIGVFWGQKEFAVSKNNLTITYNCFVVKGDSWSAVLKAAGAAAGMAGQFGGAYGWAFGLGDVGLMTAAAALAASAGDQNLFNAQQIIDKNELLDLTNGRTWQIERKGGKCGGFIGIGTHDCDWTITIESWGCADGRPVPK